MDNREISIKSEGHEALVLALKLIFDNAAGGKAVAFRIFPAKGDPSSEYRRDRDNYQPPTLVLYWHDEDGASPLLARMGPEEIANLVQAWLDDQPETMWGDYLDHDGSMGRGFRVFNEDWGHVFNSSYAICGIQPIWAWYGK